jgi:hypothetical protein
MKNRVELLKQQLQKEKDAIKNNKKKVKEVIEKKINVNKINMLVNATFNFRNKRTIPKTNTKSTNLKSETDPLNNRMRVSSKISRRLFTWSSLMMPGKLRIFRCSTSVN